MYVAKVSLQINDTMRVLTIFTVILLPLTLIAGIYGMNGLDLNKFDTLPTGFILVIIMMACAGGGLLIFLPRNNGYLLENILEVKEYNLTKQMNIRVIITTRIVTLATRKSGQ